MVNAAGSSVTPLTTSASSTGLTHLLRVLKNRGVQCLYFSNAHPSHEIQRVEQTWKQLGGAFIRMQHISGTGYAAVQLSPLDEDLDATLQKALSCQGPVLLHARVDPHCTPTPQLERVEALDVMWRHSE